MHIEEGAHLKLYGVYLVHYQYLGSSDIKRTHMKS